MDLFKSTLFDGKRISNNNETLYRSIKCVRKLMEKKWI